jgi:vacuolar-type H+-ATPase subunit I/STV1
MKEQYEQKLQTQLDEWDAEICKLKELADGGHSDGELEYNNEIEELSALKKTVEDKLTELKNASDSVWVELKAGIESFLDSHDSELRATDSKL